MNKIILIGNVGKDPETKQINDKSNVHKFSLATSETFKDKDGEKQTTTEWHNITVWNKDGIIPYIKKGTKLMIEGKVQYKEYEKDGKKTYFTEVLCYNIELLSKTETKDV